MEKNPESPDKKKCPTWKERTIMERYLILLGIVLFFAFLVMIGLLIHFQYFRKSSKEIACLTPVCKSTAGRILTNLDYSVKPCENFYNFSCGSYFKYKSIYDDNINTFSELYGYLQLLMKELLEKPEDQNEPRFVSKLKKNYRSCLKKSPSVKQLLQDFLKFTKLGAWPLSNGFKATFEDTMAKFILYSSDQEFIFFMFSRHKNGYLDHIVIGPTGTSVSEHVLMNSTEEESNRLKQQYLDLFHYVFTKLETKDEDAKRFTEEIVQLETLLANITDREYNNNYTKKTISELESECPQIKWTTLISNIYKYLDRSSNYSNNITIKIYDMDYFIDLCKFIEETDHRILHNLIVWNCFAKHLYRIDFMFSQLVNVLDYNSRLNFIIIKPANRKLKWKTCINNFDFLYDFGVNSYLLKKSDDYNDKIKKIENYAKQILEEAKEIFSIESWIDDYSRNITKLMIDNMKYQIGYENSSLDEQKNNAVFDKINVTDNYLYNILQEKKYLFSDFLFNETICQLYTQNYFSPFVSNAFFIGPHLSGKIGIPLGIMLPPFYHHGAPNYLNYGAIGSVIGHEISHNFHDLDEDPKAIHEEYNENITWPKEFREEYARRKLCLINQYSEVTLEGNFTIDGNSSIYDDFADNSGLIQAYWTYHRYLKKYGSEPKLPGLDFTNKQMFFIAFAQTECGRIESIKESYKVKSHSPAKYRVLIPLMNFPEFSKVFNCPLDSYMNPEKKCKLWG